MTHLRPVPRRARLARVLSSAIFAAAIAGGLPLQLAAQTGGRIAGRVVDRETGRPLPAVRIEILGQPLPLATDLDGRYRTPELPPGSYAVRAALIGFRQAEQDSVVVVTGRTAIADFALASLPVTLGAITVEAAPPAKAGSESGLLALQQAAPAVSDGISAQAIARSPDANAGEAVKRVTGVTLFDGKFLIVRGLGERYSNALLNGAEMPNPVVEKKIAPLDLFPSSLIESVVAAKTATPDRPGDFAGGSLDLRTKEFPEGRILELTLSQAGNDQVTLRRLPIAGLSGRDLIAMGDARRQPPFIPFVDPGPVGRQRVLQGFADNLWEPAPARVALGQGFAATYGNQWQVGSRALGAVAAVTYTERTAYQPLRLSNLYYLGHQGVASVEWGGIANFSYKVSPSHKVGWRNLYTRSADLTTTYGQGSEGVTLQRTYHLRYVERYLMQTQLTGSHLLGFLANSQLEWTVTYGRARIDDPDNHSATYTMAVEAGAGTDLTAARLVRRLADYTRSGETHWAVPLSLRRPADSQLKIGAYYRAKSRWFDGAEVHLQRDGLTAPASGLDGVIQQLPPNEAFAPENLSVYFTYFTSPNHNDSYQADDNLAAAFGMLDLALLPSVRLVGGLRVERWQLRLRPGYADPEGDYPKLGRVIPRDHTDPLWSGNLTIALSERMNLRAAASRTIARPDSREISPGQYTPLGGLGTCTEIGDDSLDRSLITNGDLRWELYPRPGELLAVSGFYKAFHQPIIELRTAGGFSSGASCTIGNGRSATVRGAELEARRTLDFLPGRLRALGVGLNLTVVASSIRFRPDQGLLARRFVGQSPLVLNAFLSYEPPDARLSASVLLNYFSDRIKNYSNIERGTGPRAPNPNWVERGRATMDAKVRLRLSARVRASVAATNLFRTPVVVAEDSGLRRLVDRYNPGLGVTAAITCVF